MHLNNTVAAQFNICEHEMAGLYQERLCGIQKTLQTDITIVYASNGYIRLLVRYVNFLFGNYVMLNNWLYQFYGCCLQDTVTSSVLLDDVFFAFGSCLRALVQPVCSYCCRLPSCVASLVQVCCRQFCVPGCDVVYTPKLQVTVLAHIPSRNLNTRKVCFDVRVACVCVEILSCLVFSLCKFQFRARRFLQTWLSLFFWTFKVNCFDQRLRCITVRLVVCTVNPEMFILMKSCTK